MEKFTVGEAVGFGWEKAKAHIGFFIGAGLAVAIISAIIGGIFGGIFGDKSIITNIVSLLVGLFFQISITIIALKIMAGEAPVFSDIFQGYKSFLNVLIDYFIVFIVVVIGLIFLIIPGIYLALRLQFYMYFILDKGMAPIDALKASWAATQDQTMNLFILGLALIGINLLGLICLVVGLLVTIPLSVLASALVYTKLSSLPPAQTAIVE
ncbi:MAG: hypothetical protein ACM3QZ_10840 [Solirubrobacterales bacterium]